MRHIGGTTKAIWRENHDFYLPIPSQGQVGRFDGVRITYRYTNRYTVYPLHTYLAKVGKCICNLDMKNSTVIVR